MDKEEYARQFGRWIEPDEIVFDFIHHRFVVGRSNKPKPCPVCGSKRVSVEDQSDGEGGYQYSVVCECLLTRGLHKTRLSAIEDWNDRPHMLAVAKWIKNRKERISND